MEYTSQIVAALLGALATLGVGVLTFYARMRGNQGDQATAFLQAGIDLHQLAAEQGRQIREELQHDLARLENALHDARTELAERDRYIDKLKTELAERDRYIDKIKTELQMAFLDRRRLAELLRQNVESDTLDEISDLPELEG